MTTHSIEDQISDSVSRFHLDQQGQAPRQVTTRIVDDMVIVRSVGIFTQNEQSLATTEDGRKLIRSARRELRSMTRRQIESEVSRIVERPVLRSFWDMDVRTADQIEVYILAC